MLTESLFLRLLGLIYIAAFASFWPQIIGLMGARGVVPAVQFMTVMHSQLGRNVYFAVPSVFWLSSSDQALVACCVAGCIAGGLLTAGVVPRISAAVCWALYLSITSVGQPFTAFQWDALLLECGFLALFAGAPWLVWGYRFLLFRLMFESGLVKLLSHDPNWRNLHALRFHFMTQPLPNPIAYYVYRAPGWLLDSMTAITLGIELGAPFLLFFPKAPRYLGVSLLMLLQVAIILTGNYAFFNLLTLALCMWAFDDGVFLPLARILRWHFPRFRVRSALALNVLRGLGNVVVALLMSIGALQLIGMVFPAARSAAGEFADLAPFEVVNTYGLFAVMTTTRPEIIIEGSNDGTNWREYSFPYKPGNLHRGLPFVAPYQPRLDWQMWFAALGDFQENTWVGNLFYRLLTGEPSVLGLLDPPPFETPPRYMRALLYMYQFTTPAERARTGAVWQRELRGIWLGPVEMKNQ